MKKKDKDCNRSKRSRINGAAKSKLSKKMTKTQRKVKMCKFPAPHHPNRTGLQNQPQKPENTNQKQFPFPNN